MLPGLFRAQAAAFRALPIGRDPDAIAAAVDARERAGELVAEAARLGVLDLPGLADALKEHATPAKLWRAVAGPLFSPQARTFIPLAPDGRGGEVTPDEAFGGMLFAADPEAFPPVVLARAGCPRFVETDARACDWLAARIDAGQPAGGPAKIVVSECGNLVLVNGQSHRLGGSFSDAAFLRALLAARGSIVLGTELTRLAGERSDRIFKRLPEAVKAHIDRPGKGKAGYMLRD